MMGEAGLSVVDRPVWTTSKNRLVRRQIQNMHPKPEIE